MQERKGQEYVHPLDLRFSDENPSTIFPLCTESMYGVYVRTYLGTALIGTVAVTSTVGVVVSSTTSEAVPLVCICVME